MNLFNCAFCLLYLTCVLSLCSIDAQTPYLVDGFLQSSRLEVVFAQCSHRHWLSIVHGCRLSATELFWSSLLVSGMNCHFTSAPSLQIFCSYLKTYLFSRSFSHFQYCRWSDLCRCRALQLLFVTYCTYLHSQKFTSQMLEWAKVITWYGEPFKLLVMRTVVCHVVECRVIAHVECRDMSPLPCIPSPVTPAKNPSAAAAAVNMPLAHSYYAALLSKCLTW